MAQFHGPLDRDDPPHRHVCRARSPGSNRSRIVPALTGVHRVRIRAVRAVTPTGIQGPSEQRELLAEAVQRQLDATGPPRQLGGSGLVQLRLALKRTWQRSGCPLRNIGADKTKAPGARWALSPGAICRGGHELRYTLGQYSVADYRWRASQIVTSPSKKRSTTAPTATQKPSAAALVFESHAGGFTVAPDVGLGSSASHSQLEDDDQPSRR